MLEVGWSEMLVIAIVMILVVGPKDLPKMLRTFGRTMTKMRQMAGDFQKQFNDALQEAELDDVKKSVDEIRGLNPTTAIKKQLNPFERAAADVRAGLGTLNPAPPPKPASTEPHPAAPLKTGPADMPASVMTETAPKSAEPAEAPKPARKATPPAKAAAKAAAVKSVKAAAVKTAAKAKPSKAKT